MIVRIFLNYIIGFVRMRVEGLHIERFVNLCISKKIFMWSIKRKKATIMYANISIFDFKRIKQICKKTGVKINIKRKQGLPFFMHKYRKRKIFLYLLLAVIVTLIVFSKFIWNIQITGNITIPTEEILYSLEQAGIKIGTYKTKIDLNRVISKMRLARDDISWIGLDLKGTNIIVKIKEATIAPEIINANEYCNIISKKTGVITKISVQNGTGIVQVNDIVSAGDILVQGYIEGNYTERRYVHSKADIQARVWYSKIERVYFSEQIKKETNNKETKYSIKINNFKINFFKTLSNFKKYDTISEDKKINIFSNFYLPLEIVKITNKEYEIQDIVYTEDELSAKTIEKLETQLKTEFDEKNIVNKKVNIEKFDDGIEVEVIYEVLENIGKEEKINF